MNFINSLNKNIRNLYTNINKKIYVVFFIAIAIFVIWTLLKRIFGIDTQTTKEEIKTQSIYKPSETVISGTDIKEPVYEEEENVIDTFVDYCNNGSIEEAYNLLSDDCKEVLYNNDIERFKELYYNELFETKRNFNIQSWINDGNYHTYKVRMIDDIMSTGNYSGSSNYQDYITLVKNENDTKISVNSLISKSNVNKTEEIEELSVEVISEIKYVDYTEYEFYVINKTDKRILMDSLQYISKTMYLEVNSNNNNKRTCISNDISKTELTIEGYSRKKIRLRYNKSALKNNTKTKKIYFNKIIRDYDSYLNNSEDYNDITMITINL